MRIWEKVKLISPFVRVKRVDMLKDMNISE